MKKYTLKLWPIVFLCYFISCSSPTVFHLKRNRLIPNHLQTLSMNYLEFHYMVYQKETNFFVKGIAYIKKDKIPSWGNFVEELWLGAYLSDCNGKVIAQDINVYPPKKIDKKGIPFEFKLEPKDFGSPSPLYITFGYRLKIVPFSREKGTHPKVFFAIEKAEELDLF